MLFNVWSITVLLNRKWLFATWETSHWFYQRKLCHIVIVDVIFGLLASAELKHYLQILCTLCDRRKLQLNDFLTEISNKKIAKLSLKELRKKTDASESTNGTYTWIVPLTMSMSLNSSSWVRKMLPKTQASCICTEIWTINNSMYKQPCRQGRMLTIGQ